MLVFASLSEVLKQSTCQLSAVSLGEAIKQSACQLTTLYLLCSIMKSPILLL